MQPNFFSKLLAVLILCFVNVFYTHAQLNISGETHFGRVNLAEGFPSDPHTVPVTSGGSLDASSLNLCSDCMGYIAETPDYRLVWSGGTNDLVIFFKANSDSDDATLIINTPDGEWIGNDDANDNTLNPLLSLHGYGSGTYDIWVGSFDESENVEGVLYITELTDVAAEMGDSGSGEGLDFSLDPSYGVSALSANFRPDPKVIEVISGGEVNVSRLSLCGDCSGFVSKQPDHRLEWSGSSAALRIYFEADTKSEDATLIINTPSGIWVGNDDAHSDTYNPMINLKGYGEGTYDIWVGSYEEDKYISGKLYITETDRRPK